MMMRKVSKIAKLGRLLGAFGLALLAPTAYADEVMLKVSHFLPPNSGAQQAVIQPWCEKLAADSGGRLKCQIYPAMQLGGTPGQLFDQVRNGVADVVWTLPGFATGRFPAIEAMELPFMLPASSLAGSRAVWEFYQRHAQKEFESYKVLALHGDPGIAFHTLKTPVKNLESVKGLKLRTPSRMASRFVAALGGTPVSMPPAQVAEAISKGVVDGSMASWELVPAAKLDEVTRFHTSEPPGEPGFSSVVLGLFMNRQKYESLPADLKAVIDRNSGAPLVDAFGRAWDATAAQARKRVREQGGQDLTVTLADYEEMRKAAAAVEQEWLKDAAAKALDGPALVAGARAVAARHLKKP